ncbi:MAG TPA: hypothetical protein DCP38_13645 [Acidobacteria bacterium]|jgi:quinol-cytochrome oxidoreductase complex cytochrome b subunit|nr:hypothetical protein [Acidobacteriota bacterium]HAK56504.1 hypothetical protein [Acidobacteriota bacterium]|tara:strand:+ start:805 stop:1899 length:1095 start_codon:yes stop_codon:yes gene_type:complete
MTMTAGPAVTPESSSWATWLASRVPIDLEALRHFSNEPVPNHLKYWWWCLGGTPALLFGVQAVTGILLTVYYIPDAGSAYESVDRLTTVIPFGWFIRSIHRWASHLMIAAVILHVMRVFFTGAYRAPRELNWMLGVLLLAVTLGFGFTGYSLVWEQLSYWGVTVAANLTDAVPVVGGVMGRMLRGGESVGSNTLTRLFILHIGVMPTLLTLLLAGHILLIRLHGVTEFEFESPDKAPDEAARTYPFFPHHAMTEVIIGVGLAFALTCLAVIFPAELAEKANPLETPAHIKPEWYFFWTFRWLKLTSLTFAVLSIGFAGFLALIWPYIDERLRRRNTASEASVYVGAVAVVVLLVLTIWEAMASS